MAPSLVQSASSTSTSSTSATVTLGSSTATGNCLVVYSASQSASVNPTISGITLGGSAGNFAKAKALNGGSGSGDGMDGEIWTDQNCAGGQTSVVVSYTGGTGGTYGNCVRVEEWSGVLTSSAVDKTNASTAGTGTWTSGSSGTLSQANELVVGLAAIGSSSVTITGPSSPWTNSSQLDNGSYCHCMTGYQVVSAATAQTYSGSDSPAAICTGVIVTLKATTTTTHSGTATLSGSGTLSVTGAFGGFANLSGSGTLSWSGSRILKATVLSGTGTLSGQAIGTINAAATLSGSGTLSSLGNPLLLETATLSGSGSLSVSGVKLGFLATLAGTGTLGIIGRGGTVQASPGVSSPYAYPGASQVSVAPPGSQGWQYLGTLGIITALTYGFTFPGGADKLTATVMVPASYRTQLLDPGWKVRVTRGGHVVWTGKLDEPAPSAAGWTLTAVGDGNRGTDFAAVYSGTWPSAIPDDPVNEAITRGLPWVNPGIGSPSGMWTGQAVDSGAQTITDLLNLVCLRGGLAWYANSQPGGLIGTSLSVVPLPVTATRMLIVTDPVARTLGGDINTIFLRYEVSDGVAAGTSATFATTSVQNAQSVTAHQVIETYVDLSSAGVMTAGQAQAVGNYILAIYQRASFAGPFTASYGQLLSAGGVPVDPGTDQAGTVVRLLLTDFGYGGEVTMAPITFIVGGYLWDDFAQKATVTPYQVLDQSLSGLLSLETTLLTPITVSS